MKEVQRLFRGQMRTHVSLIVIVIAFVLLAGVYCWVTPPFEGPDEAQHIAYIEWLARGNGFPPQGAAAWETPIEQEAGQMPLYYVLASIPARIVGVDEPTAVYQPNPHFSGPLARTEPDNDNRAIHYPNEGRPLRGGWLVIYLARTLTILFGVVLITATYGLAWQIRPGDRMFAAEAAWLIAFTPQVLFIGSLVSNDIPAAAFSALLLWSLAVLLRRAPHVLAYLPLMTGLVLGLAALTKINSLILAAPVAVCLAWLWLAGIVPFKQAFRTGLMIAAGFLLVAGWWFGRTWWLYGSPLGLGTHDLTPWVIDDPEKLAAFWARWLEVWRYYWVTMGWGTIRPAPWVYTVFFALTGLAFLGLLMALLRWWRRSERRATPTVAMIVLCVVVILANALFLEVWMRRVIAPYGRLLFPSAAAITVLLLLGWRALHTRFSWLPLAFIAGMGIVTPFVLLRPAYRPQTLTAVEIAQLPPGPGWYFGPTTAEPIAELIRFTPRLTSVKAEHPLPVEICWRILKQTATPYTIFIHIIGPDNRLITHRRSYPGNGLWLTDFWPPGATICNTMHVLVWKDLDVTGVFDLEIGILDEAADSRLLTFDAQGNGRSHNFIGKVRLEAINPPPQILAEFTGESAIQLVEYNLPTTPWQRGDRVALSLHWATAVPLDKDYQLFVHLRDANNQIVAQGDGPPAGGWYPTSWWPVGEVIADEREFAVPTDLPGGAYHLVVGFYDLDSLQPMGEEYNLGIIQIEP